MSAIEKINEEIQKDPDNSYLAIVGEYIIDRCNEEEVEAAIEGGKTLKGCMEYIKEEAHKKAKGSYSVMTDREVFDAIDKYLSVSENHKVRERTKVAVDGESTKKPAVIDMDFESLFDI